MSKITTIGEKGLRLIKESESFKSKPYKCPAGVWTIGYGTTVYFDTKKRVQSTDRPISEMEASRLLFGHVQNFFAPLVDKLCRDNLTQNEFDALVDFTYNTGGGYIDRKGKYQYYNLYENVNNYMPKEKLIEYWSTLAITANKKPLKGLVTRRQKEINIFFSL